MTHLMERTARTFSVHGVTFNSFAASHSGARSLAAWRADFQPGTPGRAHHMTEEEVVYVLKGRLQVQLDDDSFSVDAGEAVLVPEGSTLCVTNAGNEPAQAWVTTTLGMAATMQDTGEVLTPPWAQ